MSSDYGGYRKSIKLHAVAAVLATLNSPAHSAVLCPGDDNTCENDMGKNCQGEHSQVSIHEG